MIIGDITCAGQGGELRIAASARPREGGAVEPWIDIRGDIAPPRAFGNPFAAGFVVPCMYVNEPLHIDGPVSAKLLEGIQEIQSVLATWSSEFRPIEVTASEVVSEQPAQASDAVGCFFSGGADAWYTFNKHQDRISHLILVRGFDIPVSDRLPVWEATRDNVQSIADTTGKSAVMVQTNSRAVTDMRWPKWGTRKYEGDFWGYWLHGSAIAAVGLSLQSAMSKLLVGATYTYDHLEPWGSHPVLDRFWSTEGLEFIHDGAEANRMRKIKAIADSELALASLRVCYENREGRYNCCDCEKCFRTMMALRACGALERATAFRRPLNLAEARRRVYDAHVHPWYRVILPEAEAIGDRELAYTLKVILGEAFSVSQFIARLRFRLEHLVPPKIGAAFSSVGSRRRWKARLQQWTRPKREPGTV